jgi:hypothetical protein
MLARSPLVRQRARGISEQKPRHEAWEVGLALSPVLSGARLIESAVTVVIIVFGICKQFVTSLRNWPIGKPSAASATHFMAARIRNWAAERNPARIYFCAPK